MNQRNAGIDLLRGLSIVLVVIHHLKIRIPLAASFLSFVLPIPIIEGLGNSGNEAVYIFFVISGFLIASNSIARWGSLGNIDYKSFYLRRASRILPVLLTLVAILSGLHYSGIQEFVITRADQSLGGAVFSALGFFLNWYEGQTWYLPGNWDVLWSLSIEEVFYVSFPMICLVFRKNGVLLALMSLFALLLPEIHASLHGSPIWKEKAYLTGMSAIAMGVTGALIAAQVHSTSKWLRQLLISIGSAGVFLILCFNRWSWHQFHHFAMLILTMSELFLLLGFYWKQKAGELLTVPFTGWLRSCGFLSYEIYLTHMFIVWPIVRLYNFTGKNELLGCLWFIPCLIFSWMLGRLVAKYFSVPAEKWLRDFALSPAAREVTSDAEVALAKCADSFK